MKLPNLEARVSRTAELTHKAIPEISLEELRQAITSFFKKLLIADQYVPSSKFNGRAILIKALKNKFSETLGEDYSLSQVNINSNETFLTNLKKLHSNKIL